MPLPSRRLHVPDGMSGARMDGMSTESQHQPPSLSQRRTRVAVRSTLVCAALVATAVVAKQLPGWLERGSARRAAESAPEVAQPLDTLLRAIETAADSGATRDVERLCATIVEQYPDHPVAEPAMLRLLQARIRLGDERGALHAFQEFRRRFPRSRLLSEALLDVANWRFQQHSYRDAANVYTDLVALVTSGDGSPAGEDTAPEPVIWRSRTLWNAHKRAERSRTELERLARFNQALAYEDGGDREAALRAYDRFVSRFPQDAFVPEARFRMANLAMAEGRTAVGLTSYRAVYDDPLAAVAFRCESAYRAGRACQAARRFDDAVAAYRSTMPLQPASNEFRLAALGELAQLLESRDRKEALAIYRELAQSSASTGVRAVALQRLSALEVHPAAAASGR